MNCIRCGDFGEIETEFGFLCSSCDSLRLSCINNPYESRSIEDFKGECKK